MRHCQRERLRQFLDGMQEPLLPLRLSEDVLLRRGQKTQPLRRGAPIPLRPVEPVQEPAADLVLLQHDRYRLLLIDRGPAGASGGCKGIASEVRSGAKRHERRTVPFWHVE